MKQIKAAVLAGAAGGTAEIAWVGAYSTAAGALAALACVWALNFLVVLPVVNPAFVTLMPLAVTLASKLLFGAALGWTLKRCAA